MNTKAILPPRLRIGVGNFVGSLNQYLYHSVAVVHTGVKARNCMWLLRLRLPSHIKPILTKWAPLTLGVRVVAGSNPAAPTNPNRGFAAQ